LKVELLGSYSGYIFKGAAVFWMIITVLQTESQPYLSWFGANMIESVNPAKMKLCPGFHNSFASKQTIVCVQKSFTSNIYMVIKTSMNSSLLWSSFCCYHVDRQLLNKVSLWTKMCVM